MGHASRALHVLEITSSARGGAPVVDVWPVSVIQIETALRRLPESLVSRSDGLRRHVVAPLNARLITVYARQLTAVFKFGCRPMIQ